MAATGLEVNGIAQITKAPVIIGKSGGCNIVASRVLVEVKATKSKRSTLNFAVVAFDEQAEALHKRKTNDFIKLGGCLQINEWIDQDFNEREDLAIKIKSVAPALTTALREVIGGDNA